MHKRCYIYIIFMEKLDSMQKKFKLFLNINNFIFNEQINKLAIA